MRKNLKLALSLVLSAALTAGAAVSLLPDSAQAADGGPRSTTQMIIIHATDNTASDTAERNYAQRSGETSAHFYVDEDSSTPYVPLGNQAYGAFSEGNSRSVQFELCGKSNHVSDQTMRQAAAQVRRVADAYHIPIQKIGAAELRAGQKGITGHDDVTKAWGQGDHTDPGDQFNWPLFISYVQNKK